MYQETQHMAKSRKPKKSIIIRVSKDALNEIEKRSKKLNRTPNSYIATLAEHDAETELPQEG